MTNPTALALKQVFASAQPACSTRGLTASGSTATETLTNEHQSEILAFLAARPLHTVIMAGHIRDNGVVSDLNRGTFHAYRGLSGSLEGVALIGHATLLETRSPESLQAFARLAQSSSAIHLIMAESEKVDLFWTYFAQAGERPRVLGRESLLELRWPVGVEPKISGLRQATMDDLNAVMLVQAEMALEKGGVDPMEADLVGFQQRCARRIELGRTWVLTDEQQLIFKVDIMANTPEAIYLEGIWVNPRKRGKDYGLRCLTQVARTLLMQTGSICVLVDENNLKAHALYRRAGFKPRGSYQLVYLESPQHPGTAAAPDRPQPQAQKR
ncbi:MAG: GNAT family N-acetyltransferase [Pyrinomonadaceae bacterium]|nr:GNAT family N-acetyltransferase [Pyrinomonadaceae bacterium]